MTDPFGLKAPVCTTLSANIYADGVRLSFGENVPDTKEQTYHTAVFIPTQLFAAFRRLITDMEPKLAEMKNAVQN
jgi:hypothetical protein